MGSRLFNIAFVVFTILTITTIIVFGFISNSAYSKRKHFVTNICTISNCTSELIPCTIEYKEYNQCYLLNTTLTLHLNKSYAKRESIIVVYENMCQITDELACHYDDRCILKSLSLDRFIKNQNNTFISVYIMLMIIMIVIEIIYIASFVNINCIIRGQPIVIVEQPTVIVEQSTAIVEQPTVIADQSPTRVNRFNGFNKSLPNFFYEQV